MDFFIWIEACSKNGQPLTKVFAKAGLKYETLAMRRHPNSKNNFLRLIFSCLLTSVTSCSHSFNLDPVRQSSNILTCQKTFATSIKSLEEENEILLQTGIVDTSDEVQPVQSAIISINKTEIILNLESAHNKNDERVELYKSKGYVLTLTYKESKNKFGNSIYEGHAEITDSNVSESYSLEGKTCNL